MKEKMEKYKDEARTRNEIVKNRSRKICSLRPNKRRTMLGRLWNQGDISLVMFDKLDDKDLEKYYNFYFMTINKLIKKYGRELVIPKNIRRDQGENPMLRAWGDFLDCLTKKRLLRPSYYSPRRKDRY